MSRHRRFQFGPFVREKRTWSRLQTSFLQTTVAAAAATATAAANNNGRPREPSIGELGSEAPPTKLEIL